MTTIRRIILSLILFLLPILSEAQQTRWDTALDRYESICERCMELRRQSLSGDKVPEESLSSLYSQLSSLRTMLKDADGQMTEAQRSRYLRIRSGYAAQFASRERAGSRGLKELSDLCCAFPSPRLESTARKLEQVSYSSSREELRGHVDGGFFCLARLSTFPAVAPGVMAGYARGRLGIYAAFDFWPGRKDSVLEAGSDGSLPDGGLIWTSGSSSADILKLTVGTMTSFSEVFSLYAGAGYGLTESFWQLSCGDWARITDRSYSGVSLETGAIIRPFAGGLTFQAGAGTIAFKDISLSLGIGWSF